MPQPNKSTLKSNIDISRPREFKRMTVQLCNRKDCTAYSRFRIGRLDVCGRHTSWAIEFQVGEGETWDTECFIARYFPH